MSGILNHNQPLVFDRSYVVFADHIAVDQLDAVVHPPGVGRCIIHGIQEIINRPVSKSMKNSLLKIPWRFQAVGHYLLIYIQGEIEHTTCYRNPR